MKVGGSLTRLEDNLDFVGAGSFVQFLSWPDFLLGLDGSSNGTGIHSNVFQSSDILGLLNRDFRVWEASGFVQDDYRIRRSLTLNLGVRYERLGQFGDNLGRNFELRCQQGECQPTAGLEVSMANRGVQFPGCLPSGVNHSPTTHSSVNALAPNSRPAMVQQFSLNAQGELAKEYVAGDRVCGYPGNTPAALPFVESGSSMHLRNIPLEVLFRTHWPILDYAFPSREYGPTLFAKWNRRAVPGTTGWKRASPSVWATAFNSSLPTLF